MALSDTTFPVTVAAVDTQESLTIPPGVRRIKLINLSGTVLRYAWKAGVVADPLENEAARRELQPLEVADLGEVDFVAEVTLYYASSQIKHRFDVRYSPDTEWSANCGCGSGCSAAADNQSRSRLSRKFVR